MAVNLSDAPIGMRLRVVGYAHTSTYVLRLQHLGLVPGTELQLMRRAPLGDPLEIRLRGFSLALRPSEAAALQLQEVLTP